MNEFFKIRALVLLAVLYIGNQSTHADSCIIESCTKADAIHAAILSSKHALSGKIKCEYLGLLAKAQPLRGSLQSQPGVWRLHINDKTIYLALVKRGAEGGFRCKMKGAGSFDFVATEDSGKSADNLEFSIGDKTYKVSSLVQEMLNDFDAYNKVWPPKNQLKDK